MGIFKINNLRTRAGDIDIELAQLELKSGELACVVGKSGSGKTTLLNTIAGFHPQLSGTIEVNGSEIQNLPPEKRKVALVFQSPALFRHLDVIGNVEFGLKLQNCPKEERRKKAMDWLEKLQIVPLAERKVDKLSGGEAQRVALARALIVGFPVLLLDEPFTALDVELRSSARDLVKALIKELGIYALLVSHDPQDVTRLADKVLNLKNGKVIEG